MFNKKEGHREFPSNADFVVLFRCGEWQGYAFLLEPLVSVNKRTIMGKKVDGGKFMMIGGTYVQRPILPNDMTIEDALGGIYHACDFSSFKGNNASCGSVRAIAYGSLGSRGFSLELRKFIEVSSDGNEIIMIDKDNRRIVIAGENLNLYCYDIVNNDDHNDDEGEPDPFDLKTLGVPREISLNT